MIRAFQPEDLDAVMTIWLDANTQAHTFIPKAYWQENYEAVKRTIPDSDVFVYQEGPSIVGFVGLVDDMIAGIFVKQENRSQGIGKALLAHCKKGHQELRLHVYKKNTRAVNFYLRESFTNIEKSVDESTDEPEFIMYWTRGC
ncbi:MAG: N-acetyltransferase [Eubacteriales bacterium]